MKTAKNIWVLFFCSWISIWIEGNSIKKKLFLICCLKWKLHCIINRILYITSRKKIFNLMYHFWPFFFLIFIRFLCSYYWINKMCYTDKSCSHHMLILSAMFPIIMCKTTKITFYVYIFSLNIHIKGWKCARYYIIFWINVMLMEEPVHIWLHYWHLIEQETLITTTAICMVSM